MGPYLLMAVAGAGASFQCSLLALTEAAKPAVAAEMEESEACLATGAGVFEHLATLGEFEEAVGFGSVLVRESLWAWRHSEGTCWTGSR